MTDTVWFDRRPGDYSLPVSAAVVKDDATGGTVIVGDLRVPDRVRLPPDLGSTELRVLDWREALCPKCEDHACRHFDLEGGWHVAECTRTGFHWYTFGPR